MVVIHSYEIGQVGFFIPSCSFFELITPLSFTKKIFECARVFRPAEDLFLLLKKTTQIIICWLCLQTEEFSNFKLTFGTFSNRLFSVQRCAEKRMFWLQRFQIWGAKMTYEVWNISFKWRKSLSTKVNKIYGIADVKIVAGIMSTQVH